MNMKRLLTLVGLSLLLLTGAPAQAALIGVAPSFPDFQFLGSTVEYSYDSGSDVGTLSVFRNNGAGGATGNGTNFTDSSGVVHDNVAHPGGFGGANFATQLSITAQIQGTTGALISGDVVISGIMNFAPYNTGTTEVTLLLASLTEVGFDTNKLDFLATVTGGNPGVVAQFGDLGVIVQNAGFAGDWTTSFTDQGTAAGAGGQAQIDVTTPAGPSVPVPGVLPLMLLGIAALSLRRRGAVVGPC